MNAERWNRGAKVSTFVITLLIAVEMFRTVLAQFERPTGERITELCGCGPEIHVGALVLMVVVALALVLELRYQFIGRE